jgi:hypothetical protein
MVRPERFELPTLWFVAKYSIQLSYGRTLLTPLYYQPFYLSGIWVAFSSPHRCKSGDWSFRRDFQCSFTQ